MNLGFREKHNSLNIKSSQKNKFLDNSYFRQISIKCQYFSLNSII